MQEKKLSSGLTSFLRDVFPSLWTVGVGAGMLGIWLDLFGQPATLGLKVLGGIMWVGTSVLFRAKTRNLYHVWLGEDQLLVEADGRRERVPLHDVTDFSESRAQKVKTIKLTLRPGSHLGPTLRFIPSHRFQAPFFEHPIIGEIKERKRVSSGLNGSQARLRSESE